MVLEHVGQNPPIGGGERVQTSLSFIVYMISDLDLAFKVGDLRTI